MTNAVRLVNGGSIQVRTGVIQGIGPQGPRGVAGPDGQQGEQGPVGETGAMGQILESASQTRVNINNTITANTDQLIAFGTTDYDGLTAFTGSTSSHILGQSGDYLLNCWLRFDDAPTGTRELWFLINSVIIARATRAATSGQAFYVDLSFPYRVVTGTAPQTLNVITRSSTATAVSQGTLSLVRTGSGPQGVPGPPGPQGGIGPKGDPGGKGDAGTANAGFAKYSDMLPH